MKEQLISFDTAKLAKEKGFDWESQINYINTNNGWEILYKPSQSLLQTWLRKQRILVEAKPVDDWDSWIYDVHVEDAMAPFFRVPTPLDEFDTYEEALEQGLIKGLEVL